MERGLFNDLERGLHNPKNNKKRRQKRRLVLFKINLGLFFVLAISVFVTWYFMQSAFKTDTAARQKLNQAVNLTEMENNIIDEYDRCVSLLDIGRATAEEFHYCEGYVTWSRDKLEIEKSEK